MAAGTLLCTGRTLPELAADPLCGSNIGSGTADDMVSTACLTWIWRNHSDDGPAGAFEEFRGTLTDLDTCCR